MKAVVFHHNDMDGKAAGWVVHKHLIPLFNLEESAELYYKKDYNEPFSLSKIDSQTVVFIVDLSFTDNTVRQLEAICRRANTVIWIDHHQSSIDLVYGDPRLFETLTNLVTFLSNDGCGALLAYAFSHISIDSIEKAKGNTNAFGIEFSSQYSSFNIIYKSNDNPRVYIDYDKVIPRWLFHVDDYDRFKHQDPNTEFFTLGCDLNDTATTYLDPQINARVFNNRFWDLLTGNSNASEDFIDSNIHTGKSIRKYLESRYRRELAGAFIFTLPNGTEMLCKNGTGNSWNFCKEYDRFACVCLFNYDGKSGLWKHSIYARDKGAYFNAAKFCEKFGGGGHAGAAGFSVPDPIFTNIELFEKYWKG